MIVIVDDAGRVVTDDNGQTSWPGVYAAGDLTSGGQQIALAAADGIRIAIAMDGVLATSL